MDAVWTVGQVADELGVTVRTLHHYDEIGLLHPSERTPAGYRLYTADDLERLQNIVVYRRLGFPLEEIGVLLDASGADLESHLRRQRAAVMSRLDELGELVTAIDRALEKEMSGLKLTKEEQKELFGDGYSEEYAAEAEERWGDSDAWRGVAAPHVAVHQGRLGGDQGRDGVHRRGAGGGEALRRSGDQRAGHGRGRTAPEAHQRPVLRDHA